MYIVSTTESCYHRMVHNGFYFYNYSIMEFTMKTGDLIFYKNIPEFLSWLQRIVTNTIYSHVSILAGYNGSIDKNMEFDASLLVRFRSFHKQSPNMDVLRVHADREIKLEALATVIEGWEGRGYAYVQWLTTFLRFAFQRIGFKNVKNWKILSLGNWGTFCSELIWYYLMEVAHLMTAKGRSAPERLAWHLLRSKLYEYNPDTFVPQDIIDLEEWSTVLTLEYND